MNGCEHCFNTASSWDVSEIREGGKTGPRAENDFSQ